MNRGRETVARSGSAEREKHGPGGRSCEQKLESTDLVPAIHRRGAILALDPEPAYSVGSSEEGGTLERCGPFSEGTSPKARAYLSGEESGIDQNRCE